MSSEEYIIHSPNKDRYVNISKIPLEDERLSWKARGIHAYLMSKPHNWRVSTVHLASQSPKEGRDSVRAALKELEDAGYIIRKRSQNEQGEFKGYGCFVYEEPVITPDGTSDGLTGAGKPGPGLPSYGKSDTNEYSNKNEDESSERPSSDEAGPPPPSKPRKSYDAQFEEWWKIYPRRAQKGPAEAAFKARLRAGESFEDLLAAARNYAQAKVGTETEFVQLGGTFLSKDRWKDYLGAPSDPSYSTPPADTEVAQVFEDYDEDVASGAGDGWYDPREMRVRLDNPQMCGYTRPKNAKGQLVDIEGKPYKLDNQGVRRAVE